MVGAGLAGVRSVEALRARGFGGTITMIGEERHRPYDRPPLSKGVLLRETDSTIVDSDLDALEVDFRPGVVAKGLHSGVVETTEGELAYDGLVIATGARPVRLRGDGPQHVLRTIDDALELRSLLTAGTSVVIIGAGWIGAEVATAARRAGCAVTVVEAAAAPLAAALGQVGAHTVPWYAEAGVDLLLGSLVASVDQGGVTLADGSVIEAEVVVTGVGVRPATDWLAGSGIRLDNGVVTDEHLRTSLPDVVAAGDCAAWWSRRYGRRLRVEHWDTALSAPEVAVATLMGAAAVYDPVPYFWSEQFGNMVQYAGDHDGARMVVRGDPAAPGKARWAVCWVTGDDRLAAVLAVNRPRDLLQGRRLIESGQRLDTGRLADPAVPLRDCTPV
ncbi:3-phenylpropionate/trans-cinnamate dioxygenase ferredoxin reductase subunit [Streptosporangium becharense]|uniref:3-phenylpropionate/trans-cinnamate dioxygenase ferredoxin reductase subunit n=1 Tax=Streptosporangium becharense TaxID=1816182 RepID=A0A7W9IDQ7_9ACTN|nr:FAD-dependent oxidoreductase [Streptosporangium becharense]MBB2912784.1 3-phenylpropionate/trans-cinnamate dioxygenase ferredoxin reductase subunit [Streptosporangium becharense]MBB5818391.1 3-phenylpropionate/trans-cinnamate dioxygenase ferredoxin reductase subunit [Streptosporangium becharense]